MLLKDLFEYRIEYIAYLKADPKHCERKTDTMHGYVAANNKKEAYQALKKRWSDMHLLSIEVGNSIGLVDIAV